MTEKASGWSESETRAVRGQLRRLLENALFAHAERLARFLEFVVDETLAGRGDRLNQFAIAIDVFDRDESFDPTIDAIVRVEAGRLRSKLLEYYDEFGSADPIRIELPKRSYVATFQFRQKVEAPATTVKELHRDGELPRKDSRTSTGVENPVIAVLPFVNMSPDTEQEYFADGITEDLITDLSQLPEISVISRQSTFAYKGTKATIQQVCNELGANIVLEGSVRKVGDRVRITAQLIEGTTGKHLWAQRYDRNLGDIFEIQDEVNSEIVEALSLRLSGNERMKLERRGTDVIDAYDYVLRGMNETSANTIEGSARARYCFERALELDPDYAVAYARLAFNYIFRWLLDWSKSKEESLDKGFELANKAVAIDDQLSLAHAALSWAHLWRGEHDEAIVEGNLAIQLDPGDVQALERLVMSMIWSGDAEQSLPLIDKARRLNPAQSYDFSQGVAMFMMQDYDAAIRFLQRDFELRPNFVPAGLYLASSQALAGQEDDAAATIADIRKVRPDYGLTKENRVQFKNPQDGERYADGLRQAGLT